MIVDDFVLRQIQQIADLVAAIAGSPSDRVPDDLLSEIEEAYRNLLGLDADMVDSLDADTLARSLHDGTERDALIDLLLAHAEASARMGDATNATRRLEKAIALMDEGDGRAAAAEKRLAELYA